MPVTCNTHKIMVAMSGGVDSTVCASLLKDAGHEVLCVYFVMSESHRNGLANARRSCGELGLALSVVDPGAAFRKQVIEPFCAAYCSGITPNPCVVCNPLVKFSALSEAADAANCDCFASGHYARIAESGGIPVLQKAVSLERDQSYMLYRLPAETLAKLVLPLGAMSKSAVRDYARQHGFSAHSLPDSQDICFIPDGDYPAFIHAMGYRGKTGRFISPEGEPLGAHRGTEYYTIGQRRGLGVSLGSTVYVRSIRADGDIRLAYAGDEFADEISVSDLVVSKAFALQNDYTYTVKIRSAAKPAECEIVGFNDTQAQIRFGTSQRAPAPGQSAVLYDGDLVVGGGIITDFR